MPTLTRRHFLHFIIAAGISSRAAYAINRPVRIGITPVFLTELTSILRNFQTYLEQRIGQPVIFVQRDTYREIVNNLLAKRLDFAWICGYPYISNRQQLSLTAVPIYKGKPHYQSYLIVPKRDTSTRSILDLKGRVFAYTDPDSNSGFLVPRFQLLKAGYDPNTFFRQTFISAGHRNAVEAVSAGLADGANVDGYVWDTLARFNPDITNQTRLVLKSPSYGFPPIVAGPSASQELSLLLHNILKSMHDDPAALPILDRLNIDGFGSGQDSEYETIAEMATTLGELRNVQ
jgi:phosphate/phosphite/phosphonate ABC transporter binding protein